MTAVHPAVAYEPGVVPEPLAEGAKLIQFLRLVRDNQLSVYTRDSFVADFSEARLFFTTSFYSMNPILSSTSSSPTARTMSRGTSPARFLSGLWVTTC